MRIPTLPGTGDIKTYEKRVVNVLSGNRNVRRKDACAVELRAHDGNTAPQMKIFVVFTGSYFNRISGTRAVQGSSDRGDPIRSDRPRLRRTSPSQTEA